MVTAEPVAPSMRAVTLHCYVEAARFVGVDPYEMLRRTGIAPDLLGDPENRLSARSVVQLIEDTAQQADCGSFALLLAACRDFGSLGPISLLLRHVPDMRSVITALVEYQRSLNDLLHMSLGESEGEAILRWDFRDDFATRQNVELAVAIAYRVLTEVSAGRWRPDAVRFRHSAPKDTHPHRRFFACHVEFDNVVDALVFEPRLLDLPNPQADASLEQHARHLLGLLPLPNPVSMSDRAKSAIHMLIAAGGVTIGKVAQNLAVHPRNLQRQLEQEGTSFALLLNGTRRELATRALSESRNSITDIADQLGYASVTSFARWFKGEFGQSPRVWRAEMRSFAIDS